MVLRLKARRISWLELLLSSLVIITLLVMIVRHLTATSESKQVGRAVSCIVLITSAAERWLNIYSDYSNGQGKLVTVDDFIARRWLGKSFVAKKNPWGGDIRVEISAKTLLIEMAKIPELACQRIIDKLNDAKFDIPCLTLPHDCPANKLIVTMDATC